MQPQSSAITKRGDLPKVCEGIGGVWFYHLADSLVYNTKAICGADAMSTAVPVEAWGFVGHLRERYCTKCEVDWNGRIE